MHEYHFVLVVCYMWDVYLELHLAFREITQLSDYRLFAIERNVEWHI